MKALRNSVAALAVIACSTLAPLPVSAQSAPPMQQSLATAMDFDAARAAILGMAGNYKVRFDMREATPWAADYELYEEKVSGGHEVVRVVEDRGDFIALQHLLVIEHDGSTMIIKHWRQDWRYEPARILAYTDADTWSYRAVPEGERAGAWSQTVWQVDDSPRYAGWGKWQSVAGVPTWVSNPSWRPLARRDAVRGPVYDSYYAVNRHQLTPAGWIHWQDNMKMRGVGPGAEPVVQEYVLNTYTKFDDYDVAAADAYWQATKGYWAAIRGQWDSIAETKGGIRIMEVAETGSATSVRLLEIADALQAGEVSEAEAVAQAEALMDQATAALE